MLDAVLDRAFGVVDLVADVPNHEVVVFGRHVPGRGVHARIGAGDDGGARRLLVGECRKEFVAVLHVRLIIGQHVGEEGARLGERLVLGGFPREGHDELAGIGFGLGVLGRLGVVALFGLGAFFLFLLFRSFLGLGANLLL